jgi:FtsP/CotA-like multicopper oxidase with cupredoxin domain
MGTIPGPVIECNVGDTVRVHFRNRHNRTRLVTKTITITLPFIGTIEIPIKVLEPLPVERRAHSLHPQGFVFGPTSDGAYPVGYVNPCVTLLGRIRGSVHRGVCVAGSGRAGTRR